MTRRHGVRSTRTAVVWSVATLLCGTASALDLESSGPLGMRMAPVPERALAWVMEALGWDRDAGLRTVEPEGWHRGQSWPCASHSWLAFPASHLPLALEFAYAGPDAGPSPFGRGWHLTLLHRVEAASGGSERTLVFGGGERVSFEPAGTGVWRAPGMRLVAVEGNGYALETDDLWHVLFDADGRVTRIERASGPGVRLFYAERGRHDALVLRVEEILGAAQTGLFYAFHYNADGRCAWIADSTGRVLRLEQEPTRGELLSLREGNEPGAEFLYDAHHRLIACAAGGPSADVFEYDSHSAGSLTAWHRGGPDRGSSITVRRASDGADIRSLVRDAGGQVTRAELIQIRESPGSDPHHVHRSRVVRGETPHAVPNSERTDVWVMDAARDVLLQWRRSDGAVLTLRYDASGLITNLVATDPLGPERVASIERQDPNARQVRAVLWIATRPEERVQAEFEADAAGRLIAERFDASLDGAGDWVTVRFRYRPDGLLAARTGPRGHSRHCEYDARGWKVRSFDSDDPLQQTTFRYDAVGRLVEWTDALDRSWHYSRDASGRVTRERNPLGVETRYRYRFGRLTEMEFGRFGQPGRLVRFGADALGRCTSAERVRSDGTGMPLFSRHLDSDGFILSETDPLGHTTCFGFDPHGQVTAEERPFKEGQPARTRRTFDSLGRLAREVDPLGGVTTFQHTASGKVARRTEAVGTDLERTTEFVFNARDDLVAVTRRMGDQQERTHHTVDGLGRQLAVAGAGALPQRAVYDAAGSLVERIDGEGRITRHHYDSHNRRTRTVHPDGGEESWTFDRAGNVVAARDERGTLRLARFDALNRKTHQSVPRLRGEPFPSDWWRMPECVQTEIRFNPWNQVEWVRALDGGTTFHEFDDVGRLAATTDAGGLRLAFESDAAGRRLVTWLPRTLAPDAPPLEMRMFDPSNGRGLVEVLGRCGGYTTMEYDALFRKRSEVDPRGQSRFAAWDPLGRLSESMTVVWLNPGGPPLTNVTRFAFDSSDRITSIVHPDGAEEWRRYDASGLETNRTTTSHGTVTFSFDRAGNAIRQVDAHGQTTEHRFDSCNRLVETRVEGAAQLLRGHDLAGNIVWEWTPRGGAVTHWHDAWNRVVETRHADGRTVRFQRDAVGRLREMNDATGTTQWIYDAAGRVSQTHQPLVSADVRHVYDLEGRRLSRTVRVGTNLPWITRFQYASDCGELMAITDNAIGDTPFQFALEDKTRVARTHETLFPCGIREVREFDGASRLICLVAWDPAGRQIHRFSSHFAPSGRCWQRIVESDGLERVEGCEAVSQSNRLDLALATVTQSDGLGRPVEGRPNAGGETVRLVYDGLRVIAEIDRHGAWRRRWIRHGETGAILAVATRRAEAFALSDGAGAIVRWADARGALMDGARSSTAKSPDR